VTTWKDNIKMNFKEIGWEGAYWVHVARERDKKQYFVNTVMNILVA
jgi:ferric iron reductase protein FhuF